jgi:SulP family sulfate permease
MQGSKVYRLNGPLFFGSVESFNALFDPAQDPDDVIVDFINSRVVDHSALQAIDSMAEKYEKAGKKLHLRHLSPDCQKLLTRASKFMEVSVIEDPHYGVAVDYPEEDEMETARS